MGRRTDTSGKKIVNRAIETFLCMVLVNVSVWSEDLSRAWGADYGKDPIAACICTKGSVYVFTKNKLEIRNLSSGAVLSTTLLDVTARSTPLLMGDSVIVAGTDGSLGLYDTKSGRTLWKKGLSAPEMSDPVVYNGDVYVGVGGEQTHGVWRLGAVRGDSVVFIPLNSGVITSPQIEGPDIIAGTMGGELFSIDRRSLQVKQLWKTRGEFAGQMPGVVKSTILLAPSGGHRQLECISYNDAATDMLRWSVGFDHPFFVNTCDFSAAMPYVNPAAPTAENANVYSRYLSKTTAAYLSTVDADNTFVPAGPLHTSGWSTRDLAGCVVVEEMGVSTPSLFHIMKVDGVSGKVLIDWTRTTEGTISLCLAAPVMTDNSIIARIGRQSVVAIDNTQGTLEWECRTGDQMVGPVLFDENYLVTRTVRDSLSVFSSRTLTPKLPMAYALHQNFPNPFRMSTTMLFEIPIKSKVHIFVTDLQGRLVATLMDEEKEPGYYKVGWDARGYNNSRLAAGMYLTKITAGSFAKTVQMTLIQ